MNKLIIPSLVLGAVFSTITISYVFAEGKHEGGHGHGAHWMAPAEAFAKPNPIESDQASLNRGKQAYFKNCSSCHGATAKGDGPLGANLTPKPADLTSMVGMHPDGDFAWKIANGRGAMPAWKTTLSENQIWDLVNYIQALKSPDDKGEIKAMDHSKMNMVQMKEMDHSKMGHSNEDDHHKVEKADDHGHDKNHAH